ncbi:MAG: hypothetical protein GWO88_00055 [Planctomycetia bacterium]|nr:hypothetical protein [Planctomycetia bacterium]
MRLKKYAPWLIAVLIIGTVFGLKMRTHSTQATATRSAQITGPAVILFRGDNSASCRAIHRLVDEAELQYGNRVYFTQLDWSPDDPLIERYKVRFLPTVVLIDYNGKEVGRIIGESSAVQARLKATLARLDLLQAQ